MSREKGLKLVLCRSGSHAHNLPPRERFLDVINAEEN